MLDLIKVEGIDITTNCQEKTLFVNIPAFSKGKICLCWDKNTFEKIDFEIGESTNVEILELGEGNNTHINYSLKEYASLKLSIFTKDKSCENNYNFELDSSAELQVAYADFANGVKKLNAKVSLNGIKSSVNWHLASLSQEKDIKNYVVNFDHVAGETIAKMENYGVCKDFATLNFLGDATIQKGAKKANTNQTAKIMVFDKTCHVKASPKLCIYENDVDASHGASEGQINQEHIFYLTSRGLTEDEAKRLITFGYLYPIMQFFSDESVRKEIEDCIVNRV